MEILRKVSSKELSASEAFALLYGEQTKKAKFFRMRANIRNEKFISLLINSLFIFPVPLVLFKPVINKLLRNQGLNPDIYQQLIENGKGTQILISSKEAKIRIKII